MMVISNGETMTILYDINTLEPFESADFSDELTMRAGTELPPNTPFDEWSGSAWITNVGKMRGFVIKELTYIRNTVAGSSDALQAVGWLVKYITALRVSDNIATPTEVSAIETEASWRGNNETANTLANTQIQKGHQLLSAVTLIDGLETYLENRLDDALVDHTNTKLIWEDMSAKINQVKTSLGLGG